MLRRGEQLCVVDAKVAEIDVETEQLGTTSEDGGVPVDHDVVGELTGGEAAQDDLRPDAGRIAHRHCDRRGHRLPSRSTSAFVAPNPPGFVTMVISRPSRSTTPSAMPTPTLPRTRT